jgi:hypothetical protein
MAIFFAGFFTQYKFILWRITSALHLYRQQFTTSIIEIVKGLFDRALLPDS